MANPIEYIVFEPDQVLTNDHLNETFNYLDQVIDVGKILNYRIQNYRVEPAVVPHRADLMCGLPI